jgi:3-phosphoshikimate 1-carboxyvinyltransferase
LSELVLEQADVPAKIAALASGLFAAGDTVVSEIEVGDDRLERLMSATGIPLESSGPHLRLRGPVEELATLDDELPADGALSAALLLAGLLVPGSLVGLRGVAVSPAERGWYDAAERAGFHLALEPRRDRFGLPSFEVSGRGFAAPRGLDLEGELGRRAGAALPMLAALAAAGPRAGVTSTLADISEVGEASATRAMLAAFDVDARTITGGLAVTAAERPLRACRVSAGGRVQVALAASALALVADAPCRIDNVEAIVESFPRFVGSLRALGADIDVKS